MLCMTKPFWPHDHSVKFPCKDCADRHPACWSECEKYKKAKKEQDEKALQKRKREQTERDYIKARIKRKVGHTDRTDKKQH